MRLLIAIFLVSMFSCKGQGEPSFDCDAFLAQKIIFSEDADIDSLFNEFQKFKKCGVSEEDAEYLLTGPVIGASMVELANVKGSDITYGNVLDMLLEKKILLDKARSAE